MLDRNLADVTKDNALDKEEFITAMFYIQQILLGKDVPGISLQVPAVPSKPLAIPTAQTPTLNTTPSALSDSSIDTLKNQIKDINYKAGLKEAELYDLQNLTESNDKEFIKLMKLKEDAENSLIKATQELEIQQAKQKEYAAKRELVLQQIHSLQHQLNEATATIEAIKAEKNELFDKSLIEEALIAELKAKNETLVKEIEDLKNEKENWMKKSKENEIQANKLKDENNLLGKQKEELLDQIKLSHSISPTDQTGALTSDPFDSFSETFKINKSAPKKDEFFDFGVTFDSPTIKGEGPVEITDNKIDTDVSKSPKIDDFDDAFKDFKGDATVIVDSPPVHNEVSLDKAFDAFNPFSEQKISNENTVAEFDSTLFFSQGQHSNFENPFSDNPFGTDFDPFHFNETNSSNPKVTNADPFINTNGVLTAFPIESSVANKLESPNTLENSVLDKNTTELVNMGFSKDQAIDALKRYDNSLLRATTFLLDNASPDSTKTSQWADFSNPFDN
ncbi:hypothetical protein O9G_001262 [Rozella allomycis CSF55]|uniref:UBA domain-containing protein n=1 Tax=Rozella allomycis (strain CSF55) TaxID=988480 RepID=A0A075ATB2_ROZAC|nr:hypothetical protein O9G_001262 [Rozella allomycis CSF55]|eukprot:EPZ33511.1 hypothetical protein O9G_001262 [Rozella allomycis CSF55]